MSTENKQFTTKTVLDGYWVDAKGVMTPESLIKDIDRALMHWCVKLLAARWN